MSKSDIVKKLDTVPEKMKQQYLKCCKPGEALRETKKAVDAARTQFPVGISNVAIAEKIGIDEKNLNRYKANLENAKRLNNKNSDQAWAKHTTELHQMSNDEKNWVEIIHPVEA